MTDDEYLKIFEAATKSRQRQSLSIATALVEFLRRRGDLQRADADIDDDAQEETADDETTNAPETPAPLVVIPTPVEPVEKKQLDTLEILETDDDATKDRKLKEIQKICQARCNNNVVQNDEDILRGKIKPDPDF